MDKFFDPEYVFGVPIIGRKTENTFDFIWKMFRGETVLCTKTLRDYLRNFSGDRTF